MVSYFVSSTKPKISKSGPHGRAHSSISKAVMHSQALKSRKAVGRRTGTRQCRKQNRQQRDLYIVNVAGPDIKGKFFYNEWKDPKIGLQDMHPSISNVDESDVINVSTFRVIDNKNAYRHTVILDGDDNNNFIVAKVAKVQSNECLGGRRGLNKVRNSFSTMKRIKPNQSRGKNASAMSSSYKLFGYRKNQLGRDNGEYVFKNISGKYSNDVTNNISFLYCNLAYNMEKAARRIGNSLYETGVYEIIQAHSKVPSVGIPNNIEVAKRDYNKSMATALAIGENYWSKSHTDNDFYYTVLSALSKHSVDNDKTLYYFIFPKYKIMIPMTSGDVLIFNPLITHSCSNPSIPDGYIFSSYVSKKTVLTAGVTMENENVNKYE